ncbi:hypothetical protein BDR05DRAFT_971285, partial [Suillus weaverae]
MVRSPKKRQPYPNPAQHKVCAAEVILLCEKLEAACVARASADSSLDLVHKLHAFRAAVSMYPLNVLIFGLCASSASTPPILVDPPPWELFGSVYFSYCIVKRQLPSLYIM